MKRYNYLNIKDKYGAKGETRTLNRLFWQYVAIVKSLNSLESAPYGIAEFCHVMSRMGQKTWQAILNMGRILPHQTKIISTCCLAFFLAAPAGAATLSLDFGRSERILARQSVDYRSMAPAPSVSFRGIGLATDGMWYGELYTGAWDGHRFGRVLALSAGYQSHGRLFVRTGIGPAYITDTSYTLVKRRQILSALMIGYRGDGYELRLGYRHISNGSGLVQGADSPNLGEDFMVCGVGIKF